MERVASHEDRASTRLEGDQRGTAADISSMVQNMDEDELRAVLAAEAGRNPSALGSLRQYFDLTRKNGSVMSAESFTDILRQDDGVLVSPCWAHCYGQAG